MKRRTTLSRTLCAAGLTAAGLIAVPGTARADNFVAPFLGVNFGGATDLKFPTTLGENKQLNWGFGAGFMSDGVVGLEGDFSYTNSFYAPGAVSGRTDVLTAMGNLIVGIPTGGQTGGGVRPYGTVGLGIVKTLTEKGQAPLDPDQTNVGFNAGGGVFGYFSDTIGVRGDVRYFSNFKSEETTSSIGAILGKGTLNFWRGSMALVIRF